MKLGSYNQRVTFFVEGTESDGYGGTRPTEEIILSTWGRVEQLKRSNSLEQNQELLNEAYKVFIQTRQGFEITVNMMVKWRGKTFKIITPPYAKNVFINQETVIDICQA
jgi:head-tail adaptor